MPTSDGFIAHVKECLAGLGPVTVRRMFGGAGVSADGVMFAIIIDDVLYLKADATTQAAFEAEGLGPFVYAGKGRPVTMSYWRAPERLLDDPEEMVAWTRTAVAIARARAKPAAKSAKARQTSAKPLGNRLQGGRNT